MRENPCEPSGKRVYTVQAMENQAISYWLDQHYDSMSILTKVDHQKMTGDFSGYLRYRSCIAQFQKLAGMEILKIGNHSMRFVWLIGK